MLVELMQKRHCNYFLTYKQHNLLKMSSLLENCCICLETHPKLHSLRERQDNNKPYIEQLQICVPEIVWLESFRICALCASSLESAYKFHEICVLSEVQRSKLNELPEDSDRDVDVDDEAPRKRSRKSWELKCDQCGENFNTRRKFVAHAVENHSMDIKDVKPYPCGVCQRKFSTSAYLAKHEKYHQGNRSHMCTFCGKGFITKTDLNTHEKQHLNKREYKCELCQKSYNTHKDLRSHKLVVHTNPSLWPHLCTICNKPFPIKSNYDVHMRRHTGDKRFVCHICSKKFTDKCVLTKHFKSHTNVRDFKCLQCKKEYKDKRVMEVHMAKVHGIGDVKIPVVEKKFYCHVCPKAYFAKNKLTRHLYTHSGERPFNCRICQKRFTDKSYVKQHMRNIHNVEEPCE